MQDAASVGDMPLLLPGTILFLTRENDPQFAYLYMFSGLVGCSPTRQPVDSHMTTIQQCIYSLPKHGCFMGTWLPTVWLPKDSSLAQTQPMNQPNRQLQYKTMSMSMLNGLCT